jgi:hypothetical protein
MLRCARTQETIWREKGFQLIHREQVVAARTYDLTFLNLRPDQKHLCGTPMLHRGACAATRLRRKLPGRKKLRQLYVTRGLSSRQIADQFGATHWAVCKALRKHHIAVRSVGGWSTERVIARENQISCSCGSCRKCQGRERLGDGDFAIGPATWTFEVR